MAYKFQLGAARLSGSTTFEEALVGESSISAASLSASAGLEIGGTVRLDGIVDATAADADKLLFRDSDNLIKAETVANVRDLYFADVSGQATVAAGGALSLAAAAITGQTEKTGDVADADELMVADAGGLKRLDFSVLRDAVFNDVSGDATVAAGGALTIAADAVEDSMLNDNVATGLAGDGLAASSGVLAVQVSGALKIASDKLGLSGSFAGDGIKFLGGADSISAIELDLNELPAAAVAVGADSFAFVDADDNTSKKESIADLMTAVAGDGLAASSGVLAVGVDDTGIEINSDALRLKDNGVTLAKMAGITRGSIISGDASGDPQYLALGTDAQMLISDGSDLGYVSVSGDITITNAGVTAIGATKVTDAMLNDDVATGLAGDGLAASSGVLALDLNELSAAAVAVGADSFAFIDADDNTSKKESIADLVSAMAGAGLTAASGQLSVTGNNVASKADGDTLAEGYNFFGTVAAAATVTLPASPSVGDVVTVKAKDGVTAINHIKINRAGSQTIDGETEVRIESPYGAVSMVYVASNDWRII
ncbi:MAG: hypothetical protein ACXABD_14685 [Candidatus Thorarchaeota archaeon]|jgi:hypothetical protein